jgi:hypothetical protein
MAGVLRDRAHRRPCCSCRRGESPDPSSRPGMGRGRSRVAAGSRRSLDHLRSDGRSSRTVSGAPAWCNLVACSASTGVPGTPSPFSTKRLRYDNSRCSPRAARAAGEAPLSAVNRPPEEHKPTAMSTSCARSAPQTATTHAGPPTNRRGSYGVFGGTRAAVTPKGRIPGGATGARNLAIPMRYGFLSRVSEVRVLPGA